MQTVNIHIAKTRLSRLIDAVLAGGRGRDCSCRAPVARLVPVRSAAAPVQRQLGVLAGLLKVPKDFDAPLPEDTLRGLERADALRTRQSKASPSSHAKIEGLRFV
jgi:antitoxin (DNA-binding transcriptional repressor) of toxin-antitoxin stability system